MKFRLYLKSFNNQLLLETSSYLKKLLELSNCPMSSIIILPHHTRKFCVIRSPHIDKDSREQFEITTYKCFLDIETVSIQMIDSLLRFDIPAGIYCSLRILAY
jgi:small subunit ribosomal protein S10